MRLDARSTTSCCIWATNQVYFTQNDGPVMDLRTKTTRAQLVFAFSYCFVLPFALGSPQLHISAINADLPTQNTSSSTACTDLHLIVVRASTEKPGQGVIGTLATKIAGAVPGTSVEAIDYPALLNPYNSSSFNGTETTTTRLMNYVDTCSKGRVVLLGYSKL